MFIPLYTSHTGSKNKNSAAYTLAMIGTTGYERRRTGLLLLALSFLAYGAAGAIPPADMQEATRLNNLGVAYMNQQLLDKALGYFNQAISADASIAIPHLNAGIALLTGQHPEDARIQLELAANDDPHNPRVWYNLGLLERQQNHLEAMMADFQKVLADDPRNADAHYFLGSALSDRKDYAAAIREYQSALAIVPIHASAEFGLARALNRVGDMEGARQHLEHFQRITQEKLSSPLAQTYGDQGLDSLTQEMYSVANPVGPMIPVSFALTALLGKQPLAAETATPESSTAVCQIDLAGTGDPDLLVMGGPGPFQYLRHHAGGTYERLRAAELGITIQDQPTACAVGDFDNDGHPDLALALTDRVLLFHNRGDGTFTDVTTKAGLHPLNHPAAMTFVDFDHDGDLDLLLTGSPLAFGSDNVLWRNNGDQTFTDWTAPTGLAGTAPTTNAILSDLNNDRAVDLIVAGQSGVALYLNRREGPFTGVPLYDDHSMPAASGVTILDFDKDGLMDIAVTHAGAPGISLWKNIDGTHFKRVDLTLPGVRRAWGITPIDFDNDGWIDLAAIVETEHGTELRVLRNLGPSGFQDVSAQLHLNGLSLPGSRGLIASDVDGDGAADLIVSRVAGLPFLLHNVGGNLNHSAKILIHGLADNKTGLGTKVEVFAAGNWQKFEVSGSSGYLSQAAPVILAGLGAAAHPEIIRLLWPTGVPQDEIDTEARNTINLTELDRRGSSCPVVFAWNGSKYEFITDTIGAAVVGHWFSPTTRNKPDPDEWIKIGSNQLRAHNGMLSLRMGEPMEEVNYIDQVKLVAIDHPPNTNVYADERFRDDPPFASGRPIVTRSAHPAHAVWDSNGRDVSTLLLQADHRFVHGFKLLPYDGFANLHRLTLDLGPWSPAQPLRLLMTGYIEYFSASSLYAAWQAGISPISPFVEAQRSDGSWTRVINDMGFPAGLERTMVADLTGKLPAGTRRIRIITNLQIYWDQLQISNDPDATASIRQTELPLASASLAFRGYPKQIDGKSPGDLSYDYQQASQTGPFVRAAGLYTRTGDVTPLLEKVDDHFAIFGSGEDLDLEFRPTELPSLPEGWTRDYFFYANGYVKDMDFYEALPTTVADLPFHRMSGYPYPATSHFPQTPEAIAYELEWNDRPDGNNPRADNAFHYQRRNPTPEIPSSDPGQHH